MLQNPSSPLLLTPKQAAAAIQVSEDTLSRWRTQGRGPAFVKLHRAKQGLVRYRMADLEKFIAAQVCTATA
jgi:predicted site-specific integrase-resolvase